jgi:hypothetical protein
VSQAKAARLMWSDASTALDPRETAGALRQSARSLIADMQGAGAMLHVVSREKSASAVN